MARFEKGHPKPPNSGRKKGSLNERTKAEAACAELGIDPFILLGKAAIAGDISAIIQLCKHIEPPKKPVEVALDPDKSTIKFIFEDYTGK